MSEQGVIMESVAPRAIGRARFERSCAGPHRFFATEAEAVARACAEMARRFREGGRLLAFGSGAAASDAAHVAVEFVHPVIVGKRALPAIALEPPFEASIRLLGRPPDIAMGIAADGEDAEAVAGLRAARGRALLTIGLGSGRSAVLAREPLDHRFVVADPDPLAVQEVHETLYHVLWELVHVYFEAEERV